MLNIIGKKTLATWLLLLAGAVSSFAQLKFHVADFAADPFDLTARSDRSKKVDGSGSLYAVIKVSGDPGDRLREYMFDFGNMNHLIEEHDGLLWIYVQKNAKRVTIRRSGYDPLLNHDLQTTVEEGKTYRMKLSAQGPVVYMQMLMFQVQPADARASIIIKGSAPDAVEQMLGTTDASGAVARNMPYDTYTYRIFSENYYPTEGRITLNDKSRTHNEQVTLRPRFAQITLSVDGGAEIWVNGEKKGAGTWTGPLNAGAYSVECRQASHRSSQQTVTVEEGNNRTVHLTPPSPVVGTLSLLSTPLGANIKVDGKDYGTTPRNIDDLLVGQHTVTLSLGGYDERRATVEIKEQQTADLNLPLTKTAVSVTPSISATPSVGGVPNASGGRTFTVKGVSFTMMPVEGGTFQMGAAPEKKDEVKPVHSVTLSSYSIGQTEVTQALWTAVMGSNPSNWKGDNLPVEQVSWDDCQTFITKLNQLTGQKFRLPTEAEWEFAARGGTQSKGYKYSGSNIADDVAWYYENSGDVRLNENDWAPDKIDSNNLRTHPVATKHPNEIGLYDMSGNVLEWCQDWYGPYSASAQNNPTGPSYGSARVLRGGSWIFGPVDICSVCYRCSSPSDYTYTGGFRLAL